MWSAVWRRSCAAAAHGDPTACRLSSSSCCWTGALSSCDAERRGVYVGLRTSRQAWLGRCKQHGAADEVCSVHGPPYQIAERLAVCDYWVLL